MRPQTNEEKWLQVASLKMGDTIKLTTGEIVEFIKMKQKNFVGIMEDGKSYNIFINKFSELIKQSDQAVNKTDYMTLKAGEAFYINKSGNAMLFYFVGIESGRIIGVNPITKGRARIEATMYAGKVSDFKG